MGIAAWLLTGALLLGSPAALAQVAPDAQGRVLRIDGVDLYATIGLDQGVRDDDVVLVYRTVSVPSPSGSGELQDLFYLGNARVVEAGSALSRVRAGPELARQIKVGDAIRIRPLVRELPSEPAPVVDAAPTATAADAPSAEPAETPAATAPAAADPVDLQAFRLTFERAAGVPTSERLGLWLRFLEAYPESDLAPAVQRELEALAEEPPKRPVIVSSQPERAPERVMVEPTATPPEPERPALELRATALAQVEPGQPVRVLLTAPEIERVAVAQLYYRRAEETVYRFVPMQPYGDTAMVGTLPADAVQAPGVDWYVAVQDSEGEEHRTTSMQTPWPLKVDSPHGERGDGRTVSELAFGYDYADFYYLRGIDRFHVTRLDYLHRLFGPLYSVRLGFGRYVGTGGLTETIDDTQGNGVDEALVQLGFEYGYTALEFHPDDILGLTVEGMVGVMPDGLGYGVEGLLRVGPEQGANLLVGVGTIKDIGTSYSVRMHWTTVPRVPMAASVVVTDEPSSEDSDWGVRFAYSPRFELARWLAIEATVGYQLRNIHHQGPVFGGQGVIRW
jgi:hypothetical protein